MPSCAECKVNCRGKLCRECFTGKRKTKELFNLHEITASQNINSDESLLLPNTDGTLFSNPSFDNDGVLADVLYTASSQANGAGEVATETFSLVKLVSTIMMRETAPLRKEIDLVKTENKKLRDEIEAMKAEREVMSAAAATASISPNENIESALAPYKEALMKIAPIEQSLQNHQRYLDQDDAKKREMNVIITGVKEANIDKSGDGDETGTGEANEEMTEDADMTAVKEILRAAACDVVPLQVRRLGKRNEEETRNRPLLVVTKSSESRREILQKKSKLKDHADERFKTIYIKPDEPLAIRKEWKRLRDALKKEKDAPTNQGIEIKIDYKTRKLLRDGTVIDQFKPPFHKRGPNL